MTFPIFVDLLVADEHVVDPFVLPDVEIGRADSRDSRPEGSVGT